MSAKRSPRAGDRSGAHWDTKPVGHGRPRAGAPANVLRAALSGPFESVRSAARAEISRALLQPTIKAACEQLGVSRRAFEELRRDFPEIDTRE